MSESHIYFHSGAQGDIIYSLPAIISLGGGCLVLKKKWHWRNLSPLLLRQPYLKSVELYGKQQCTHNFDGYRKMALRNPDKLLTLCHLELFGCCYDLSQAWMCGVEASFRASIIVSCTPRYHDRQNIDWGLLREFQSHVGFVGHEEDFEFFRASAGFEPRHISVRDAAEFASVIKGSRLFIGNQSLGFALAESMKHPRVLEICHRLPNCMPQGDGGYTELSRDLIRRHID